MAPIQRLLAANRSEIAIRIFRSAHELGIRTIAIHTYEDRFALHRFKADEAYQVGQRGEPIGAYLDVAAIVALAKRVGADAIHPGYGFLSERAEFAAACAESGITFVGPSPAVLERLGDKTLARALATEQGVPVLGGSDAVTSVDDARARAGAIGFPVMLKAAKGGGGRGMRVVADEGDLAGALETAQREAKAAFGSADVFIERFIPRARHIEVQLLGDAHGNLVHLYERDCSVQRRHQKVVEIAPAPALDPGLRRDLCDAALAIGRAVHYENAGTVEFLVDADTGAFHFIEVNPRIQVEHTVTEEVTGIDIVRSQILVAQGCRLADPEIGLASQDDVVVTGSALQCRVTTEDPSNNFMPDYGRVEHYRSGGGAGVRLDAGSAFSGAVVQPYYDSLLVKVTARGRRFIDAVRRMDRALSEIRVRGVKTNIPFLLKLIAHPSFTSGKCTTRFIDETPALFELPVRHDRATRLLTWLAELAVNGNELVVGRPRAERRAPAPVPAYDAAAPPPPGTRQILQERGAAGLAQWVLDQAPLLLTDTTFRDAHQSLLATRVRTDDLVRVAPAYARLFPELFSIEMWGGATFDTTMRFLKESPWDRLRAMRAAVPNVLFQMLLRASNAVGYTNYPDNVVVAFVEEAADKGIDVFRVFDALNWVPNMRVAMDAVLSTGAVCEASICYSGDVLDPKRTKYDLKYYVDLARELESMGAHIIAIKDMAGLCKPKAAAKLVTALKQEVGVPIHFHTHDTVGTQGASILEAAEAGVDIVDAAMAPMSGTTSQPNLNAIVEMLRFGARDTGLAPDRLDALAGYWRAMREFYVPFESPVTPATGDLYRHEMPGGQYTNLYQQARALGLADRWIDICRVYADVNQMLGDIVKVTPTSKAVGDMALFMVANELTPADVVDGDRELAFPQSVIDLVGGKMGQPPGGFPDKIKKRVLRGDPGFIGRPGETMAPADFQKAQDEVRTLVGREPTRPEVVSSLLYPKVFADFAAHRTRYGDTSGLPTPVFLYGVQPGEEIAVEIERGKTLIVTLVAVGEPHADGRRTVFFELNGQPRDATVVDRALDVETSSREKADPANPKQVGAAMPGMVVNVMVAEGDKVARGQKLLSLEAMKMETAIGAEHDGVVARLLVQAGSTVETGDLLVVME